ncbi:MAG TPA: class I mannose-6-phosphate isomerase, partial [Candidatus Hydrogenedens sp.]|nr:class I mannose-6-phosphate isomerase [Candidatus Hydrogenedens sp.]
MKLNKPENTYYFKFDEGYFCKPWGNYALVKLLNKNISTEEPIGEAWLISDRGEFQSTVIEGELKGKQLKDLVTSFPEFLFGSERKGLYPNIFPLLLKLIDANEVLSVQVHPSNKKAKELGENDSGKTEMWYILEAKPNSFLYIGLKNNVKKQHLLKEIQHQGDVEQLLNKVYVKSGEYYLIPPGTIHAIGPGILLAEIQQNSNLTYRLYDWNRRDSNGREREIHLQKAIDSIEEHKASVTVHKVEIHHSFGLEKYLCSTPYFIAKHWSVEKEGKIWSGYYTFHIILGLNETLINIF